MNIVVDLFALAFSLIAFKVLKTHLAHTDKARAELFLKKTQDWLETAQGNFVLLSSLGSICQTVPHPATSPARTHARTHARTYE